MKAKRVIGARDAPNLPALQEHDYTPYLWNAVKQATWTLKEAACFVNESKVLEKIELKGTDPISRSYMWLLSEYSANRLCTGSADPVSLEPLFTPGSLMRHLWEGYKPVSLRVWALYDIADKGIDPSIQTGISKENYIAAARVIWTKFPSAKKASVVQFLEQLPKVMMKENGLPYLLSMSTSYLDKLLKGEAKLEKGRPVEGSSIDLEQYRSELLKDIKNKLNQLTGQ